MPLKLKCLSDQVIVVTGASSGIGLATARMAAARGARLVLVARSAQSLEQLTQEIRAQGGDAILAVADVSRQDEVHTIALKAIDEFGGFDTWINNAGTGMYAAIEQASVDDMRRLFETNFWGVVYGSLEAVSHLKARGGALINMGSAESERALPLQGVYAASKHAVKAFTDALRMELEAEGAPISVTLVKPGSIDTPFTLNARNYLDTQPKHVPPVYAPEAVARAILHCAEHPVRDVFAGGGAKGIAAFGYHAPRLTDLGMERYVIPGSESGDLARPRHDNGLMRPSNKLQERGNYPGHVMRNSLYTQASLHPALAGAVVAGAGLALRAWLHGRFARHPVR
jgi:short-subunit dehydrogenase